MADSRKNEEGAERSDQLASDLGNSTPPSMQALAENLPEKDEVQKAYKEQMLADSAQAEAKAKVKIVDASPDADETPSGYALKKVVGIAHDQKRGEAYAREKTARRWGHVPAEDS